MVKTRQKSIHRKHRNIPVVVFFLFLIVILMQTSFVSALEWDNIKTYDSDTNTATIVNLFGLGDTIAEVTLDSPYEVMVLPGGNNKVAEFTINSYTDYLAFGDMEFYNYRTKEEVSKEFTYKYKTTEHIAVDNYKTECKERVLVNGSIEYYDCVRTKTGSHFEYQDVWNEINEKEELKAGEITIGIFTDVSEGEKIEWIPNLFGERIEEWANFIGSIKYERFDNVAETPATGDLGGASSCITQPFQIGKTGTDINFEVGGISLKLNRTGTVDGLDFWITDRDTGYLPDMTSIVTSNTTFDATQVDEAGWQTVNITFATGTTLTAGTNYSLVINQTDELAGGGSIKFLQNNSNSNYPAGDKYHSDDGCHVGTWVIDGAGGYTAWFQTWGIGGDPITTTLISPTDASTTVESSLNFTANHSEIGDYNLINATFKVWTDAHALFNESTRTIDESKNQTILQIDDFTLDSYIWNVITCGMNATGTECASAVSNYTFTLGVSVSDLDYTNDTIEGSVETFKINVTTMSGVTVTESNLIYNNTNYGGTWTSLGGDKFGIVKTITVPFVSADINKSFYFNFLFSTGSSFNTSEYNQTVRALSIDDCTGNNITILNYTLKDEENQTTLGATLFNTTIDIDVDIYAKGTSTSSILNFSQSFNKDNPAGVCISHNLSDSEYALFVTTKYVSNSRETEYHYLQNYSLTNTSIPQNISLYDLLTADSESFAVTFKDDSLLPVSGALINVQRQYVDEGVFKSVEIGKTDTNGRTILHLVRNDIVYTMVVTKDGLTLATFDNVIAFCDDFTIGDCKISLNQESDLTSVIDLDTYQNLNYHISFDEDARNITFVFSTIDGSVHTLTLNATKFDMWGNTTVCDDKLSTSSGTLICHIPDSYGNISFRYMVYSYSVRDIITSGFGRITPDRSDMFGATGIIFILIMVITLPLMMITSTIGVIIGAIIGLIAALLLMLYTGGAILSTGSAIMWLIIAGIILIWKIAERSKS